MNCNLHIFYLFGILVAFAYDDISFNKIATQSHTWEGPNYLYRAGNAVDRNIATCMRARGIGTSAPDKTVWWKVDLGGVYSIYSVNILFKNYDGYGCGEGWYGVNCSQQCVGHCRDRVTCNHVTGQCDGGCDTGWSGTFCNKECDDGTYGYNCVNNCSGHCFNGSKCNKQTGHCDRGCNPGYTTGNCSKVCPSGHYGINCRGRCSGHCINSEPCNHISGDCSSGCQDGFVGTNCNNSCTKGYFSTNCSRKCSLNCKPDTCRHTDGSCTTCDAGWTGFYCTTACVQSFGENCRQPCSLHCYNNTCDTYNGRCLLGCKDGFSDILCDIGSMNQNSPCSIMPTIGLSVSLLVNLIFIVREIVLYRRSKSSEFDGNLCWKRSIYQETVVKTEESSTYQELDLSENAYQNTAIR